MKMSGNSEKTTKTEDDVLAGRRPADGKCILVYRHQTEPTLKCPKEQLTALVVTKSDEVYGAGVNSLVGNCSDYPMKVGGDKFLQSYVKVDDLSGRNIKKIVVGSGFGAALSNSNEVVVWGKPAVGPSAPRSARPLGPGDFVAFEAYSGVRQCCYNRNFGGYNYCESQMFGGIALNYCPKCGLKQVSSSDDAVDVKTFIQYKKGELELPCYKCFKTCNSLTLESIEVQYCTSCGLLLEKEKLPSVTSKARTHKEGNVIYTIPRANDERIKDIACTGQFICMLLENSSLVARKSDSTVEYTEPTEKAENSTSDKRVALYGGGESCLFVKTEAGTLFKWSTEWQSGADFKMTEIKLPAAVDKACCGSEAAAALLADGSVWFITADSSTYRLYHHSGVNTFADIGVVTMNDTFLVQTVIEMKDDASIMDVQFGLQTKIQVQFFDSGLDTALKEMVCSPNNPVKQDLVWPTPRMAQLYGKQYLADLTIKLADEELPAHSCVLFSTSTHFQETFSADKPPPKVLDMSEYNPKAYKYLLQYFYQVKPGYLEAEDLVDLRQIATSYGESALADAATAKIKAELNEQNVLRIFARSKNFDFKDVMNECERVMRSPTFADGLLQAALKNLAI